VVVPVVTPVTIPVNDPIVATDVVLLAHVPPIEASVSVIVAPTHTAPGPLIGTGSGLTVTITVLTQPVLSVYVTGAVPVDIPNTIPDVEPIEAAPLPVLHIPPPVASLNATNEPAHTIGVPDMAAGNEFTVTAVVVLQPVPIE
jgi:hypothetical protein